MVKLQKRFAYKYKDREHFKHVITIPEETLNKLGWNEGQELEQIIQEKTLIVLPSSGVAIERNPKRGKERWKR